MKHFSKFMGTVCLTILFTTTKLWVGEMHEVVVAGDSNKVLAHVEADPTLLKSKDEDENTPLMTASSDPLSFILQLLSDKFFNNKRAEVNFHAFADIAHSDQAANEEDFQPLFDGETLNGWDGDSRLWSVEDGAIVGSTDSASIQRNTFLIYTEKQFGDFVFRAQVKLRNHNSGIQFRSEALPEWVCQGYQADMAEGNWWGCIYDEGGRRGVLVNGWRGKAETVVNPSDWNDIEIYCQGENIRITLNGMVTAELKDSERLEGFLGLQLHMGPPMEVKFRNIRIKELR